MAGRGAVWPAAVAAIFLCLVGCDASGEGSSPKLCDYDQDGLCPPEDCDDYDAGVQACPPDDGLPTGTPAGGDDDGAATDTPDGDDDSSDTSTPGDDDDGDDDGGGETSAPGGDDDDTGTPAPDATGTPTPTLDETFPDQTPCPDPCLEPGALPLSSLPDRIDGTRKDQQAGAAVAVVGDVDRDGYAEVAVGVPADHAVYLYAGPVAGARRVDQAIAKLWLGAWEAGEALDGAGDMNGDGYADLVIGSSSCGYSYAEAGGVFIMHGPIAGGVDLLTADATIYGEAAGDLAGAAVAGVGDVNDDARDDVLIGAPGQSSGGTGAGAAYLLLGPVSGSAKLHVADARLVGENAGDQAGAAVAGAGDVNDDGFDDLLVGAPGHDSGGADAGAVYLVYGPVSDLLDLSTAGARLTGEAAGDLAGSAVAGAGDVNDDGYDDLLIGAPGANGGQGAAYIVYGPVTGKRSLADADVVISGEAPGDQLGASVNGPGDLDRNGFADLVVGAPGYGSSGTKTGAAYVLFGPFEASVSLSDGPVVRLEGELAGDQAGGAVGGGGDVDDDGFPDLLVGARFQDGGSVDAGAAYLVPGAPAGVRRE